MSKYEPSGKTKKVYEYLRLNKVSNLKEITNKTGVNYNTVRGAIIRLRKYGMVRRNEKGMYEAVC